MTDLSPQRRFLLGLLSVIVALLAWYGIRTTGLVTAETLASPAEVWAAAVDIVQNGYRGTTLQQDIGSTMRRCLAGFAAAVALGVPLGAWLGMSRLAAASINFIIQFLRPLPPLSYLVLLILWFGAGDLSKIVLLFVGDSRGQQRVLAARSLGAPTLPNLAH